MKSLTPIIVVIIIIIIIILLAFTTHLRVLASSVLRFRDHRQGRTTVDRTPLDE
jgi:Sec-independent protein translocase protein TatA